MFKLPTSLGALKSAVPGTNALKAAASATKNAAAKAASPTAVLNAAKGAAVKAFVNYALTKGQANAPQLGYVSLPAEVVTKAQAALATVK